MSTTTFSSNIDVGNMNVEDKNHSVIHPQVKNRVALLQLPVTHNKDRNLQTAMDYIRKAQCAGAQLCVLPEIWNSPYATSAFPEYAELLPQVGDALPLSPQSASSTIAADSFPWGMSSRMLMEMAKSTSMYIVGGSIPEVVAVHHTSNNGDNHEHTNTDQCHYSYYNTCLVINPHGKVVAKHRKVHLFDVNVPGGIQFKESETLTAGDLGATYFDVEEEEKDKTGDEDEKTATTSSNSSCELGRIGVGIWYVFVSSLICCLVFCY
jgi:predicted amidohydrolase